MATLTTRFNTGESVWYSEAVSARNQIQCPDCLGTRKWDATLPNGESESIECPSCKNGYWSCGTIGEYAPRGEVRQLTIGQVTFDSDGPRYMCNETGVGSGRVYHEGDLYATEHEANESLAGKVADAVKQCAERGLNEYLRNRECNVGNMTAYYRKEIRDAKRKLEQAQRGLDRIRGK